jgi:hypothetical protein
VGAGALATNGAVKVTSARSQAAASPTAPTTALPAPPTMPLGAEAVGPVGGPVSVSPLSASLNRRSLPRGRSLPSAPREGNNQ